MGREFTERDYDQLSWHDDEIRGISFRVGDPARDDWTSDLVLDIDHILEWVPGDDCMRFLVAPADLVFHATTDLEISIDSGTAGQQVSLVLPSISAIEREPVADQRVHLDRAYYHWRVRLNGTPGGEIRFGAVGFTLTLRSEPFLTSGPALERRS